ncbi:MAG: hypothetical protein KDB14_02405 [Planctomycetales bacterium]|nr:hypothetical protein [Planctomycetales bacterium]
MSPLDGDPQGDTASDGGGANSLIPGEWYWIRLRDQSLRAYRYCEPGPRQGTAHFYVGSQLQKFSLSCVVGKCASD